jgi:hypothetical protein
MDLETVIDPYTGGVVGGNYDVMPGPESYNIVQAGMPGISTIVALLSKLAPSALALLSKYWPQLAMIGGTAAVSGIIGGITGGGNGGTQMIPGTTIPLVGPFALEPPAQMTVKQWAGIGGSQFYLLVNGRIVVRKANGVYKVIKRPHMLHMKTSNPRMGDVVKADRIVARTAKILRRRLK